MTQKDKDDNAQQSSNYSVCYEKQETVQTVLSSNAEMKVKIQGKNTDHGATIDNKVSNLDGLKQLFLVILKCSFLSILYRDIARSTQWKGTTMSHCQCTMQSLTFYRNQMLSQLKMNVYTANMQILSVSVF